MAVYAFSPFTGRRCPKRADERVKRQGFNGLHRHIAVANRVLGELHPFIG